jgi:gluconokinase
MIEAPGGAGATTPWRRRSSSARPAAPDHLVVMGVAGSGKSTVAGLLAQRLGLSFAEADGFHPAANIAKMSVGRPLDDDDRAPWLDAVRGWLATESEAGRSAVVACSALRRDYRDLLRTAGGQVRFVHLTGGAELLAERMHCRSGHYMPVSLLPSQLATLEPLADDEGGLVLDTSVPPDILVEVVVEWRIRYRAAAVAR